MTLRKFFLSARIFSKDITEGQNISTKTSTGSSFTAAEKEAMKERAREAKLEERRAKGENMKLADEAEVLDKISKMSDADRKIAEKIHALVKKAAPGLDPKTWYGMPAYAKEGKTICFFQESGKFKTRYSTLGFSDQAKLDEGDMWASSFAITKMTPKVEKQITELLKKAIS